MNHREDNIVMIAKTFSLVVSGLLLVLGVILAILGEQLAPSVRFMIGIECLLIGSTKIFGYFSNDLYRIAYQFDFAAGCVVILFGLLLLIFPTLVMPHFASCIAIYVMVDGFLRVQTAIDAKRFGMPYWYFVLIGALMLVAGAAVIYLLALDRQKFVWIGVMLIADSFLSVLVTMYTVHVRVRKVHRESEFSLPDDGYGKKDQNKE